MSDKTLLHLETLTVNQLKSRSPQVEAEVAASIRASFGPGGPGILLVSGLHDQFQTHRQNLFTAGRALSALSEKQLSEVELAHVDYAVGWSRGRESFRGVIDTKKGSFYANPVYDHPADGDIQLTSKYPHYMTDNAWPKQPSCASLQTHFKALGTYIHTVGCELARHCDKFIQNALPNHNTSNLEASLRSSRAAKGRLLNYFPSTSDSVDQLWCGYHNDHGTLTGLIAGQFYNAVTNTPLHTAPDNTAGLYVYREGSEKSERVVIPPDCIAFQIGETAQIASGGVLRATPHAVKMPKAIADVARVTLAVFLQPNPWEQLKMPEEVNRDVALRTSEVVPDLTSRYQEGDTFAEFAAKTIKAYCT